MNINLLSLPIAFLVTGTALSLLVGRSWRWILGALAIQYAGVSLLTFIHWPVWMSAATLLSGWMAAIVLFIAMSEVESASPGSWRETERSWPSGRVFRLLAASLIALLVLTIAPVATSWIPGLAPAQAYASLFLIGLGLLHLGLTAHPLRVITGLLTVVSGFEVVYAVIENSSLVVGLLSAVTLGLAMIGTYLVIAPQVQEAA